MSEGVPADTGAFRVGFAAGLQVAGYRLAEEIGRGSMALLYRAREERLGRLVALKILAPKLAEDEAFRRWFVDELRAVDAVRHPHIIPVFEVGEADGLVYIAMRYVPGGDARSLVLREGPLPPGRVTAILWQAASALDALHGAGLLHGDVKPANMLIDAAPGRPDWVYLSDVALSAAAVSLPGAARIRPSLSTLACMSPELIEGGRGDGRADQYALSAVAFELLTGWPPVWHDDASALLRAQLTRPPPRLTSRQPDLPPAADDVMARALAKAPQQRYDSCREFVAALAGALGLPSSGPGPRQPGSPPRTVYLAGADGVPASAEQVRMAPVYAAQDQDAAGASRPQLAAAVPARPGPAGDGRAEPWLVRRQPRGPRIPLKVAAIAMITVLAVAAVVVGATGVLRGPAPPKPLPRLASFPIAAKSALPPVSGDVWVKYQGGAAAQAELSGVITGAARGYVARLYAQPFPYTAKPAPVASAILHPKDRKAPYAFPVTPALATRYQVMVFPTRTARRSLASSPATTVYVALNVSHGPSRSCTRPTCHETFTLTVFAPPPALGTEISKRWYTYFGLSLSKSAKPPPGPSVLELGGGGPRVSAPRRVAADEFAVSVAFTFSIGKKGGNTWFWAACTPESEAVDGVGLPGHHGCGDTTIPAVPIPYLG